MSKDISIYAVGPRVIIKEPKVEEKTPGGIIITKEMKDREQDSVTEGTIVHLGRTAFDWIPEGHAPRVGDKVFYKRYAGVGKMFGEQPYRIITDEDIYGTEVNISESESA